MKTNGSNSDSAEGAVVKRVRVRFAYIGFRVVPQRVHFHLNGSKVKRIPAGDLLRRG